ncbi:MAG: DNA-directed RNA polymerase subunit alpha [Candidatus Jorgensenbacteria bacterium GW2011_GWA1_48_11]|uniref:DNA-directed RNA polymerase subunit alpha n=1 Tax=Candidatus Jorgensenbacteria bacterium GW2011_GWA1_48_11 TaxID=1618660 RepID=A0A0G1WLH2_9BACT|nr:MAG: DNA-directed RNA polymerase subunit alpha [Candidatus Jorgensenbacteria bacterium GW2011_GWA1_48_11]KKW11849.1 MAG: DNA-directed RNA polymerase subunit alpha [Candidatus Jorgensenbacteria bacterium GW2011_GWB1_49_9]
MQYSYLSESVSIKKISEEGNVGIFHIEGLYTGYGTTMGNALRRVLLSSLPGAAITQIKIKGVDHEFSTLPGMVEDIVALTLNLKKVRFHFFVDEPQVLKLQAKGEKEVTASDIGSTAMVKVVNGDIHIASLTKKNAELDMELTVEKGLGYVPSEARRLERLPVGTVVLDAIFSPIQRVEFNIENMRVGERTDYNRLKMEIETDGSISPSEALHKTANILRDHFEKVSAVEQTKIKIEGAEVKEKPKRKKKSS